MEFVMQPYGVYIKTDTENRITAINSSAFLPDTSGWMKIDEGFGDAYHHAQGNYLPGPLMDERGIYRYKLVDGQVQERTQEEMDADYTPPKDNHSAGDSDLAKQVATLQQRVNEQAAQLAAYEAAYMEGVNEA